MKKNWIKTLLVGAVIFGGIVSANAHTTFRTFNILPFGQTTTSTYNKTDTATKVGVSLNQAGVEEVRDVVNFVFKTNGATILTTNCPEGESRSITHRNFGPTVSVTFKDTDYLVAGHSVKGYLYW